MSTTKERIIRTAHDLFHRVGFHAVGIDAIIADVGVTKTTFYNHFPSKDDLVREVLAWHDRWWQDTFRQLLRTHGGDSPRGQLLAVPDVLEHMFQCDDYNGCFFINVAVQFPQPHDPAHKAAADHKRSMEAIIREVAGYGGATDPAVFAQDASLVMEGAYVTGQINREGDTAAVARRLFDLLVEKYLPDTAA